ncbi:MAG TPA: hypothetical protein VLJ10_01635 [Candidatus Bathyarchaeia archaeon]|nr:hypothetical protein [Candidatus Bathyarchaeia archaeon]
MNRQGIKMLAGMMALVMVCSGCYTTGLSMHETGKYNYSNFVYSLYEGRQTSSRKQITFNSPIKLGVAQVGESSVHSVMMDALEEEKGLFTKVVSLPLGGIQGNRYGSDHQDINISDRVRKLCLLAEDMGLDYVFLFGGSAESGQQTMLPAILDITIVGMFIVPSQKVVLESKASGALIDVKDRSVIFMVSADQKVKKMYPTALSPAASYGNDGSAFYSTQREILIGKLAEEFTEKVKMYF